MARGRPPGLIEMQAPGGEISHARLPPEQMSRNRIGTVGEMKCKHHRKKKKNKNRKQGEAGGEAEQCPEALAGPHEHHHEHPLVPNTPWAEQAVETPHHQASRPLAYAVCIF